MSEPAALTFSLLHRVSLRHEGDVALLAADGDDVWAEEMYSGQWLAQYHVAIGRGILACADEDEGRAADLRPLNIPPDAAAPKRAWAAMGLNVAGARQHGLREDDRLADVLHPLSVADKFALADWLHVSPPALLGLAERYVLAECPLAAPDDLLLCCRLRVAVAVTPPDWRGWFAGRLCSRTKSVSCSAGMLVKTRRRRRRDWAVCRACPCIARWTCSARATG